MSVGLATLAAWMALAASGDAEGAGGASAPEPDPAVATVNGEPILRSELVRELVSQHGDEVLEKLIARRVLAQDMARRGVAVTDAEVDSAVEQDRRTVREAYGEKATLEEMVASKLDMNLATYREQVVRVRLFIEKTARSEIRADEATLLIFFAENRERYDTPDRARVRHLLVRVDPMAPRNDWVVAKDRAERLLRQARGGMDFVKLVAARSDDEKTRAKAGLIGWISRNDDRISEEFRKAVFELRPGETGGPVMTAEGYHLVEMVEFSPGAAVEFEKVAARVREDYVRARMDEQANLLIRRLLGDARIMRGPQAAEAPPASGAEGERAPAGGAVSAPRTEKERTGNRDKEGEEEPWPKFRK